MTQTILVEPITNAVLQVHGLQHLGGDEAHLCYLTSYTPDEKFLAFDYLGDMVFLLKNVGPKSNTMTMQAVQGSKVIVLEQWVVGEKYKTFSGICLKKISELDFIELKESVNAVAALKIASRLASLAGATLSEISLDDVSTQKDITIS